MVRLSDFDEDLSDAERADRDVPRDRFRVVSWNINSVRSRFQRLIGFIDRHRPDVVALQETKVTDAEFPTAGLAERGYRVTSFGQQSYNGVAFVSRERPTNVARGFPGDPVPEQARVISADFGPLRLIDLYVVNGKSVGHPNYERKLRWLDAIHAWLETAHDPADQVLLVGDFNIAPEQRDTWDPDAWDERILASTPERQRLHRILDWGLTDLHRLKTEEQVFTWWDYRLLAFEKGHGLRIDLALGTNAVAGRCLDVWVDRDERKRSTGAANPSDHAPLVVDLALPPAENG